MSEQTISDPRSEGVISAVRFEGPSLLSDLRGPIPDPRSEGAHLCSQV